MSLGVTDLEGSRCQFVVWAPLADKVEGLFTAVWPQLIKTPNDGCGFTPSIAANGGPSFRFEATSIG
jgi:hypothetical protein